MLTKDIVRDMIEDNGGLCYLNAINNGGTYVCNEANVNTPLFLKEMPYGVNKTNYYITVTKLIYREQYMIVEYTETRRGYDNGTSKSSTTIPYCNVVSVRKQNI